MTSTEKAELFEQLRIVDNKLSPENLACDGEAPRSWVVKEGRRLNAIRRGIIAQLGYEPTWRELYPQ